MPMCESDCENMNDRIGLLKELQSFASSYSDVLCLHPTQKKVELLIRFSITQEQWEKAMDKHLEKKTKKIAKQFAKVVDLELDPSVGKVTGAGQTDPPFTENKKKNRPSRIPQHSTLDGE